MRVCDRCGAKPNDSTRVSWSRLSMEGGYADHKTNLEADLCSACYKFVLQQIKLQWEKLVSTEG